MDKFAQHSEIYRRVAALAADKAATPSERAGCERVMRSLRERYGDRIDEECQRYHQLPETKVYYRTAFQKKLIIHAAFFCACQPGIYRNQRSKYISVRGDRALLRLVREIVKTHRSRLPTIAELAVHGYLHGAMPVPSTSSDENDDNQDIPESDLAAVGGGYEAGMANREKPPHELFEGAA